MMEPEGRVICHQTIHKDEWCRLMSSLLKVLYGPGGSRHVGSQCDFLVYCIKIFVSQVDAACFLRLLE